MGGQRATFSSVPGRVRRERRAGRRERGERERSRPPHLSQSSLLFSSVLSLAGFFPTPRLAAIPARPPPALRLGGAAGADFSSGAGAGAAAEGEGAGAGSGGEGPKRASREVEVVGGLFSVGAGGAARAAEGAAEEEEEAGGREAR